MGIFMAFLLSRVGFAVMVLGLPCLVAGHFWPNALGGQIGAVSLVGMAFGVALILIGIVGGALQYGAEDPEPKSKDWEVL